MNYYFAPMEGVTGRIYRTVHYCFFGGPDRYYMPFISPTSDHLFTPRELKEISPDFNGEIPVVPQILTKSAEDFLWAANGLAEMGYSEVNLNLGCPSATVTAKGKGSGMLLHPENVDEMLERIFSKVQVRVSVKTRIGYHSPEEYCRLIEIYNQYPICELTVHPRTKNEMYSGEPHRDIFLQIQKMSRNPLCYNGNIFSVDEAKQWEKEQPELASVMIGRGGAEDPAFFRKLRGGKAISRDELWRFHLELYTAYTSEYGSVNGMRRMKEQWHYLISQFENSDKYAKKIARTSNVAQFEYYISSIFQELPMKK